MTHAINICQVDDIPDNTARGFSVRSNEVTLDLFIVRKENSYYGYINRCPHTGVNLEWQPDKFLDTKTRFIQCSTHGARFRINDGLCIYGPCNGRYLTAVPVTIDNGVIYLNKN